MASALLSLPAEVLDNILSQVQDQSTLSKLCRCSRLAHACTLPHLFRDVLIEHSLYSCDPVDCEFYPSLHNFTLRALSDSQRAGHVRRFSMSQMACPMKHQSQQPNLDIIRIDALLTLLLPLLPRLKHLEVPHLPNHRFWTRMLDKVASGGGGVFPRSAFGCLQHLFVSRLEPYQLRQFLKMPTMKSIKGCLSIDGNLAEDEDFRLAQPKSSRVTSLSLQTDYIEVESTVAACSELKELELELVGLDHIGDQLAGHSAAAMQASQTLETLSLRYTFRKHIERWIGVSETDVCRISLTQFPHLRNVTIGICFVFGPKLLLERVEDGSGVGYVAENDKTLLRCLPPNIETLRVVLEVGEELVPILMNVEALLHQKAEGQFERLVSIVLDYKAPYTHQVFKGQVLRCEYSGTIPSKLSELATNAGIEFRIICSRVTRNCLDCRPWYW